MVSEQFPIEPIAPIRTEIPSSAETPPPISTKTLVPPVAPIAGFMDDSNPCLLNNGNNPGFEVWQDLKERFTQINGPRVYQLQKAIASLSQDQCSVSTFYTKLKALWDELINFRPIPACNCGALKTPLDYQHYEYMMKFLFHKKRGKGNSVSGPMLHGAESGATALVVTNYKPYGGNKNFGKKERPVRSHCGITSLQSRNAIKFMDIHQVINQGVELQPIKSLLLAWDILKAMHHCLSPLSNVSS
uniref:Uncharacterized protein n=1 Tax=Fagus sylvatica TaxID=28930 RepID=A0A2N9ITM5_FAGSY